MADYNYSTIGNDNNTEGGGNSKKPLYLALIGLLLLINGVLLYNNLSMRKANKETITTLEADKASLQAEYDAAVKELDNIKVEKANADSTVSQMQQELELKKNEIQKILGKANASKSELAQAKTLIESLRTSIQSYEQQISQLQYANQQLTGENTTLKRDVETKSQTIQQQTDSLNRVTTERSNLLTEKEELSRQKEELTTQKDVLTQKVNRASTMIASNITVEGVRNRRSGKEVKTDNNKKVQKIKICFDLLPNAVALPGNKEVLLRILSPQGEVLAVQALGSGIFTNVETGEEMQFTKKANIPFNNIKENFCVYWEQNSTFDEGTYTAEVYNNGYLIGSNTFEMK